MEFAALPPEVNSGRMYSGPGSKPMLAAATMWDNLAGEFESAAHRYASVISQLAAEWSGPTSSAMSHTTADHVAWMHAVAAHTQQAATQAKLTASAYDTAFDMTVPPPVIAANRSQLMTLIATNILGQNAIAIAANEAAYAEMWAQDATAMYTYAATSAGTTSLTPPTPPRNGPNPASATPAAGADGGNTPATLSQLASALPNALQTLSGSSAGVTGPVEAVGGSNPLSYLAGFGLVNTAVGSVTFANSALAHVATGAAVPTSSPLLGAELGTLTSGASAGPGQTGLAADAASAQLGQAETVGNLSVPRGWGTPLASRPAGVSLPGTPIAVPETASTLPGGLGLAGAAGGVIGSAASGFASRPAPRAPGNTTTGEPPQTQAATLEALHETILREVVAAAEYWGGLSSRGCQDVIARLGHNFQVVHAQIERGTTTRLDDNTA
jgi:PPE-repeat protein